MAHTVVEVKFAQNLAANERKTRDKALKKLKKYLRLKSSKKDGFKEEDFLKLWKGLHYCLWMQDKPLIQEELSNTLAKLVHELQDADARFLFLHTFFTTEAREWNSLDIWRIDKFMMLMRNVLHELLVLVQKESWSDESVSHLVDVIRETGLHHCKDSIPDGIKIHLADIYMEEVEKVANGQLDGRKLLQLLEPFCNFILKAQNTVLVKRVISRVFEPILTAAENTLTGSNQEEDEEKNSDQYSVVKFDNRLLADRLFKLSLGNECLSRNRPLIHDFVKRLRAVEEGVLPEDDTTDIKPGLNYQDYNDAIQSLTKLHQRERKKQIEHLKKKKKGVTGKKNGDDMNNNKDCSQATNIFTESSDNLPVQKCTRRKRKHSQDTEAAVNEQPHIKSKKQFTSNVPTYELNNSFEENSLGSECFISAPAAPPSDINSHDQVKDSPGKRQQSYDLSNRLSSEILDQDIRPENATEDVRSRKSKTPPSQREISKKASPKGDSHTSDKKFKTVIKVSKLKKKSVWAETPISDGMEYTGRKAGMEGHLLKKDISCVEKLSAEGNRSKYENKLKKNSDADNTNSDKISKLGNSQSTGTETKNSNLDVIQDGEIEIWVPNKKLKAKIGESAFAKFEKARIPSAYVKKAFAMTKKQSPGHNSKKGGYSNRTSTLPSKKVQFDMKKNKALAFKDSLHISPVLPFHPDKKPDQGILKSTPEAVAYRKTCPRQHRSSLTSEHRPSPVESVSTPVTDVTIKQKKSFTRAKAADFFL